MNIISWWNFVESNVIINSSVSINSELVKNVILPQLWFSLLPHKSLVWGWKMYIKFSRHPFFLSDFSHSLLWLLVFVFCLSDFSHSLVWHVHSECCSLAALLIHHLHSLLIPLWVDVPGHHMGAQFGKPVYLKQIVKLIRTKIPNCIKKMVWLFKLTL